MSLTSMGQLASSPAGRSAPSGNSSLEKALNVVAAYIPSEALATYIALLAILVPASGTTASQVFAVKAICFVVGLAMSVGLIWLTYKPGSDAPATARRKRFLLIVLAVVSFIAYSLATPGGFWDGSFLGIAITVWGAALVIVLAGLLPVLAKSWGLRP